MRIDCGNGLSLRPWHKKDVPALVRNANNRNVWLNLTHRFPHPYKLTHAEQWIERARGRAVPPLDFAITLNDEPIGGIGMELRKGVYRRTAEVGYWLGEIYWGKGFATAALKAMATYALERFDVERLEAAVFEWNPASCRVLEKAGFTCEGRLRKSIFKDGHLIDSFLYARLREDRGT